MNVQIAVNHDTKVEGIQLTIKRYLQQMLYFKVREIDIVGIGKCDAKIKRNADSRQILNLWSVSTFCLHNLSLD